MYTQKLENKALYFRFSQGITLIKVYTDTRANNSGLKFRTLKHDYWALAFSEKT